MPGTTYGDPARSPDKPNLIPTCDDEDWGVAVEQQTGED